MYLGPRLNAVGRAQDVLADAADIANHDALVCIEKMNVREIRGKDLVSEIVNKWLFLPSCAAIGRTEELIEPGGKNGAAAAVGDAIDGKGAASGLGCPLGYGGHGQNKEAKKDGRVERSSHGLVFLDKDMGNLWNANKLRLMYEIPKFVNHPASFFFYKNI